MFQLTALHRSALILVFALVLAAGAACGWGGMYVVKRIPVGADRSIVILTHDDYEISRSIYYQVKIGDETVVSTCRMCTAAKDPNSLNYKILSASGGNLIALYEETNPERILALHDFSKRASWPRGAPDEWNEDIDKRGESLLAQLQQEYPTSNFRLNNYAACGIEIPQNASENNEVANSAIRSVDFANVAYPNFPDYSNSKEKHITLKPGQAAPSHVDYGDVTGDGAEEALVAVPVETRGSAIPYHVYIFIMEHGEPKVIWDFDTGDRSDGGLRQLYAENGQLVIELYGRDRVVSGELYKGDEALCCPSSFTRARYTWTSKSFERTSQQVLENPARHASPMMPVY